MEKFTRGNKFAVVAEEKLIKGAENFGKFPILVLKNSIWFFSKAISQKQILIQLNRVNIFYIHISLDVEIYLSSFMKADHFCHPVIIHYPVTYSQFVRSNHWSSFYCFKSGGQITKKASNEQ
jgi:hypothetical protein